MWEAIMKSILVLLILVSLLVAQEIPAPAWQLSVDDPGQTLIRNNDGAQDIAYNQQTGHLLLLVTEPVPRVIILQAGSGDSLGLLDTGGIPSAPDSVLNQLFITPSGEIYACNFGQDLVLYKWEDELNEPQTVFSYTDESGRHFGTSLKALYDSSAVRLYIGSDTPTAQLLILSYNQSRELYIEEKVNLSVPLSDLLPLNPETFWGIHPQSTLSLFNTYGSSLASIEPGFMAPSPSSFDFFLAHSGISFLAGLGESFSISELSDDYSVAHPVLQTEPYENEFNSIAGAVEIARDLNLALVLAPNNHISAYDISDLVDSDIPSTGIVLGKVTSALDDSAIVGAEILLQSTDYIVTADDRGEYGLIEIPIGSYHLVARDPQFISQSIPIKVGADSVVVVDFELHPRPTAPDLINAFPRANEAKIEWSYIWPESLSTTNNKAGGALQKTPTLQHDFFREDILGYNIYKGESADDLNFIDYLPPDSMSFIDQQPWPDSSYYYAVTALFFDGETEPATVRYYHPPFLAIAAAKQDIDGDFRPDYFAKQVTLSGIITTPNFSPQKTSFFLQDDSAGIHLFSNQIDLMDLADFNSGDRIAVSGTLDQYNGLTELHVDAIRSLVVIGKNEQLPPPITITPTELGEKTEGMLVRLQQVTLVDAQQWPAADNNGVVSVTNGSDTVNVYIDKDTDLDEWGAPAGYFSIIGIASQFTRSNPPDDGYQIRPRSSSDFILHTGVTADEQLPLRFEMGQNYPNPFNPTSTIRLQLPKSCDVELSLYNILGEKVAEIFKGELTAGEHHLQVNAAALPSGTYLYKVRAGGNVAMRKMLLLK
jgi:hypothetical protein